MPGPLSVTFSDIYMLKPENDILLPIKPNFYRWYVDDIFTKRKVNMNDILFEQSNNYHPKIKLAIELNRNNFLDTKLICINSICNTIVNWKSSKLSTTWWSKVHQHYKRNAIIRDLHRSIKISAKFADKVKYIKTNFIQAGHSLHFVDTITRNFQPIMDAEDSSIIAPSLFNEYKPFILADIPSLWK